MMNALLLRYVESDHGTLGVFIAGPLVLHTMELPYRDNKPNMSRIPSGSYACSVVKSRKYGYVYMVNSVFGRSNILIHNGNFAGDILRGLRTHSQGCILVGMKTGWLCGQHAVLGSRIARRKIEDFFAMKPFTLTIKNEV